MTTLDVGGELGDFLLILKEFVDDFFERKVGRDRGSLVSRPLSDQFGVLGYRERRTIA